MGGGERQTVLTDHRQRLDPIRVRNYEFNNAIHHLSRVSVAKTWLC